MEAQHDRLLLRFAGVDIAKGGTNARIAADTNFMADTGILGERSTAVVGATNGEGRNATQAVFG